MRKGDGKTTPVLHFRTDVPELDRVLQPAAFYGHPDAVVADTSLSISEKRAILASWASDACALPSRNSFRLMPGSDTPVAFDDIMDALRALDYGSSTPASSSRCNPAPRCDA